MSLPGCAFYEWLMTQRDRQDSIGALAQAVAKFPAEVLPTREGYMIWMKFLRDQRAGERWRELMRSAFDEFYEVVA